LGAAMLKRKAALISEMGLDEDEDEVESETETKPTRAAKR
jgi:hypothetical protein